MKKIPIILFAWLLVAACAKLPTYVGVSPPVITAIDSTLCVSVSASLDPEMTKEKLLDLIRKGLVIHTPNLDFSVSVDQAGHVWVNGKICGRIK